MTPNDQKHLSIFLKMIIVRALVFGLCHYREMSVDLWGKHIHWNHFRMKLQHNKGDFWNIFHKSMYWLLNLRCSLPTMISAYFTSKDTRELSIQTNNTVRTQGVVMVGTCPSQVLSFQLWRVIEATLILHVLQKDQANHSICISSGYINPQSCLSAIKDMNAVAQNKMVENVFLVCLVFFSVGIFWQPTVYSTHLLVNETSAHSSSITLVSCLPESLFVSSVYISVSSFSLV